LPCSPKSFRTGSLKCSPSVAIRCSIPSWAAGQPRLPQRISNETRSGTKSIRSLSRLPGRNSTSGSLILWARSTRKRDPRKLTFGSRIEKESEAEREEFFTVKEILSPEKVRLSNGLTVKLIGIKSEPFTHDKAVGYLTEKIKGKRIFLKYDKLRHHIYPLRMSLRFLPIMNAHLP
jgi:hypothetical protein